MAKVWDPFDIDEYIKEQIEKYNIKKCPSCNKLFIEGCGYTNYIHSNPSYCKFAHRAEHKSIRYIYYPCKFEKDNNKFQDFLHILDEYGLTEENVINNFFD